MKERVIDRELANLYKSTKRTAKSGPSFFDGVLQKFKSSASLKLNLSISNVHVRLEDPGERAALGVTITSLTVLPADSKPGSPTTTAVSPGREAPFRLF